MKKVYQTGPLKVSVIIPFYNRIPFVLESIQSVQKQTHHNWELLLVDDGSTDDLTKIRQLVSQDQRVHLFERPHIGISAARNFGIQQAIGEYIAFLDSDDLWMPTKLQRQLDEMVFHGYSVSHTSYRRMKMDGTPCEIVSSAQQHGRLYPTLMSSCGIATPTIMVCSTALKETEKPFPENFHIGEDICLWIDLSYRFEIGGIDEPLTLVRVGDSAAAYDFGKQDEGLNNILQYIQADTTYHNERNQIESLKNLIQENRVNERMKHIPKVSIVIPVYNGANYMRDAIDSALAQTYDNIEVIVVNDGSQDDGETECIALSYGDRIQYFSKPNGGVATALNLGIEKMTGEYFSWLSHDDMYTPEKIEQELRYVLAQPDPTTIIAEGYQVVDPEGNYLYTVNLYQQYKREQVEIPLFALFRGGINGCALLIHKSHFQRVGQFNPALPTTQDYDLWFRMFRGQKLFYAHSANVRSRSHPGQGSKADLDAHVLECDNLWIGMMSALTDEERIELSGSNLQFYRDLLQFLRTNTLYAGAIAHATTRAYCESVTEYRRTEDPHLMEWICAEGGFSFGAVQQNVLPYCRQKKSRPRVAFFLEGRDIGGGLNRVVLQVAGLLTNQYDVILICSIAEEGDGYPVPVDVTEIRIPWGNWDPTVADRLVRFCYLLDTDVLICSYNCAPNCLNIYEEAQKFSIHTIAWNHEFYLLPYWREALQPSVAGRNGKLAQADAVVWLNAFSAEAYGLEQCNGLCLPNPFTIDMPGPIERQRTKNLIAAGRFEDSRKGLESLLRMFAVVVEQSPETELTILGSYDLKLPLPSNPACTYQKLIWQLNIPEERLHFVGWVTDVDPYYRNADLHVLPSIHEGFGLVILEAAAYGLPSVVYGGSGMDDIITDGVDGMIVPAGDWKALAEKVLELLEYPEHYAAVSAAARKLPECYNPQKVGAMWCDVVDIVLHKNMQDRNACFANKYRPSVSDREDFYRRIIQVYEACIDQLTARPVCTDPRDTAQLQGLQGGEWYEECMRIQRSLSWRITKPLRLVKKAIVIWKREGFATMMQKIQGKLKK